MVPTQIDPGLLSPTLQEICEVVGIDATMAIVDRWGGDRLIVPVRLHLFHPLVEVIGLDQANRLSFAFGGSVLTIGRATTAKNALRDQALLKDRLSGTPIKELVKRYQINRSWVFKILEKHRDSGRLGDLSRERAAG